MQFGTALSQKTTLNAALALEKIGVSVIPLNGKRPAQSWRWAQERRAGLTEIREWAITRKLGNLGIVLGKISNGGLVCIDLDGQEAVHTFYHQFPAYCETLTVRTGNGRHLYYLTDDTRTTRTSGYELRGEGCYVVAPPSIHPQTGRQYQVMDVRPVARMDLSDVRKWIASQNVTISPTTTTNNRQRTMSFEYGLRALDSEIKRLRITTKGSRNNQLNACAYNLGQLVGDGILTEAQVEQALLAAALDGGLKEGESIRTIRSGLKAGIREPRSVQWSRR